MNILFYGYGNHAKRIKKYLDEILKLKKTYCFLNKNNNISIEMSDVKDFKVLDNYMLFETGSPHYVEIVDNINQINVYEEGSKIRNSQKFKKNGKNIFIVSLYTFWGQYLKIGVSV